jgi:hypothetical protein
MVRGRDQLNYSDVIASNYECTNVQQNSGASFKGGCGFDRAPPFFSKQLQSHLDYDLRCQPRLTNLQLANNKDSYLLAHNPSKQRNEAPQNKAYPYGSYISKLEHSPATIDENGESQGTHHQEERKSESGWISRTCSKPVQR